MIFKASDVLEIIVVSYRASEQGLAYSPDQCHRLKRKKISETDGCSQGVL